MPLKYVFSGLACPTAPALSSRPSPPVFTAALLAALSACFGTGAAQAAPGSPCLIEPSQRIALRAPVSGTLSSVTVERGAFVRRGQVLVTLDSTVEQAALATARYRAVMEGPAKSAQARLSHAQARLKRREELQQQSFVSAQDRDDAAADMRVAESDLIEARDNRELARLESQRLYAEVGRRVLTSPITGVVTDRLQNPGELAQAGETGQLPILKLAQIDPLRVDVVLPVAKYGQVKVGDLVDIQPEAPFKGSFKALVKVVDRVVDSASGTFTVRMEVPNPKGELPVGAKCAAAL
jgi:RND family efflux transporter MFP subunit